MDDLSNLTITASSFILAYTMISKHIQNKYHIPDPLVAILLGIIIGKHGVGLLNTRYVFSKLIVSRASRIILCLQTMAVSLTLPQNYVFKNLKNLFNLIVLLGIIKCFIIFFMLKFFSTLENAACWAIAASLTPTDPILSSSIVKGEFSKKNVSEKLRILLSAESGINDGLGIIMLNISTEVLKNPNIKAGMANFLLYTIIIKVLLSAVIGYLLGQGIRLVAVKFCSVEILRSGVLSIHFFALTFLCLALMDKVDGSELICIFFAGTGLNNDGWYTLESTNKKMAEIVESCFTNGLFIFIGSLIDFNKFTRNMLLVNILIILLARPISLIIGYKTVKMLDNMNEAMFIGWFGPIGVGALYYCIMYEMETREHMLGFAFCSVFLSTLIHGLSVPIYCLIRKMMKIVKRKML